MLVEALVLGGHGSLGDVGAHLVKRGERDPVLELEAREERGAVARVDLGGLNGVEVVGVGVVGQVLQPVDADAAHDQAGDEEESSARGENDLCDLMTAGVEALYAVRDADARGVLAAPALRSLASKRLSVARYILEGRISLVKLVKSAKVGPINGGSLIEIVKIGFVKQPVVLGHAVSQLNANVNVRRYATLSLFIVSLIKAHIQPKWGNDRVTRSLLE